MVTVECALCKKAIERSASKLKRSKHAVYFCNRMCKDRGQRIGGIQAIQPPHYGTSLCDYRSKIDMTRCAGCNESRQFLLVAHHADGNRRNNDPSNIECVCQNCHAIRHLHLVEGVWKFNTRFITPQWAIGIAGNTVPLHGSVYGSNP